jgi:hypothetical protein
MAQLGDLNRAKAHQLNVLQQRTPRRRLHLLTIACAASTQPVRLEHDIGAWRLESAVHPKAHSQCSSAGSMRADPHRLVAGLPGSEISSANSGESSDAVDWATAMPSLSSSP